MLFSPSTPPHIRGLVATAVLWSFSSCAVLAQTEEPNPIRDFSSLPPGMVTLVGVLAIGLSAWLQGGMDGAPNVVRATRFTMGLSQIKGLWYPLVRHANTGLHVFSLSCENLTRFVLDSAQRGFSHVYCSTLSGVRSSRLIKVDERSPGPVRSLERECQDTKKCSVAKAQVLPIPSRPICVQAFTLDHESLDALYGITHPGFAVDGCIYPLSSLVNLPLRLWKDLAVITTDQHQCLLDLGVTNPMECFLGLRRWFNGTDIWDTVKVVPDVGKSDATYMIANALRESLAFPFEDYQGDTIPWSNMNKTPCDTCAQLAWSHGEIASLAMVQIAVWFCQHAFPHEALYTGGILMVGNKNASAADLYLEIHNNKTDPRRSKNSTILNDMKRKGAFVAGVGYNPRLEHGANCAEVVIAFVLSMVADPGVWVAASLSRRVTVRVLSAESERGYPMGQRWRLSCIGRLTPLEGPYSQSPQGICIWGHVPSNHIVATIWGWLVISAALAGTRFRSEAAKLHWCTNFGIPRWVGWLALGVLIFVVFISICLSFFGPASDLIDGGNHLEPSAGPIAAEASLRKFTPARTFRLLGMLCAVVLGTVALLYPSITWLGYMLEVVAAVLWLASEEYTYGERYLGSAVAVAILASGLGGITRSLSIQTPPGCGGVVVSPRN